MKHFLIGPETDRLKHRAMTAVDAEAFFALNSNPEVMRYTGETPLQSIEQAKSAIENYPDFETVGYGRWACVYKNTNTVIGFCGLKYLEELDCVDVGYRFLPEYWGQGLATEACAASIAFGLNEIKLNRIIALVLEDNPASIRVLEKCGMKQNGTISYDELNPLLYEITQ
ncbi:MAG: GNAT family N-acetyltransferase [Phycisphaerales bacterium]|nr:GNAT family N-acetyltransferase [Phycisphaerales bacterium]